MNEQGSFVAALLDASRKAYAAGAVLRLQEGPPETARFVEALGFAELVDDAQVRLQHLGEALACGRRELFALDVEWLEATYMARELPLELLVAMLRSLQAELRENLPGDAGELAADYLQAGLDRAAGLGEAPRSLLEDEQPHVDVARRFLLAVLEGDRTKAEGVIEAALDAGVPVPALHTDVITRVQAEVGRMWQVGEIHVAEEHLGSRIVEDVLVFLRHRVRPAASSNAPRKTVVTASVAGNLHDIGARIVSDQFHLEGWKSIFLGADMPAGDLVLAVRDFKPDLVALSVGLGLNLRAASETIEAIRKERPDTKVLVGGRPFDLVSRLWADVGADGCASDAVSAVQQGEQLVSA